jgi:asparagine synthase (glutamine-hydrolysing)
MSGISGIFAPSLAMDTAYSAVQSMLNAMRLLKPDGQGMFQDGPCTLGHAQPISEEGVTLIFSGTFYTFREERKALEKEGAAFRSNLDSEVLLKLYLHYGFDCILRLRGVYAFALWDAKRRTLFCARDSLGIKPLLYSLTPQGFVFASELKGLLASGLVSREVDRQALRCLLERGSVSQPLNILRDVRWLLPGHMLILREGSAPEIRCFSTLKTGIVDTTEMGWEDIVTEGKSRIITALERQVIPDITPGAFLSGGIDSSLLAALIAERHGKVRTFSIGFESGLNTAIKDETEDALEVARHIGADHSTIVVRQAEAADNLRDIASGLDHPTIDGVNSWFAAKAARSEMTIVISGTGGDELFAGYPWFDAMRRWVSAPLWKRFKRGLKGETFLSAFDKQYRIFSPAEAAALCRNTPAPAPRPDPLPVADILSRVTGLLLQGYTRDQLFADGDATSMWHGLEIRLPLLDEDLLNFALSIPPEAKIGPAIPGALAGSYAATGEKRLLLAIGEQLLPPGFAHRAKRGFTLPFDGWLHGGLAEQMNEMLSVRTVRARGFFTPDAVAEVRKAFQESRCTWVYPWLLMMTELWAQEVLDG